MSSYLDELKAYEGVAIGPPVRASDPVNQPMIRHWCDAMGDTNPVYTDPDAAAASVHGEIIAPPTMLQAWGMWGFRPRPSTGGTKQDELLRLLDREGFTSVVATNCEQEYVRDLHLGDQLEITSTIESVSEEKKTGLGVGHFVTTRQTYRDAYGEVVATMLFRILKFKPVRVPASAGPAASSDSATPAASPDSAAPAASPDSAAPAASPDSAAPAASPDSAVPRPLRPRPSLTLDNRWWFEAFREHRLLIQRCRVCGALRNPPRPMCDRCRSLEWDTVEASGRGTVYSFVVNHYPQVAAFDYPLPVGLIELEEGTRLVADIVRIAPAEISIGLEVEVEFIDHDPDLSLPAFHPASTPSPTPRSAR